MAIENMCGVKFYCIKFPLKNICKFTKQADESFCKYNDRDLCLNEKAHKDIIEKYLGKLK